MRFPHGYLGWRKSNSPKGSGLPEIPKLGAGDYFPSCRLYLLKYAEDRKYLGIRHNRRTFSLEDVESKYLLIEIYNEICYGCLAEVVNYKALYRVLNADDLLRDKVRMMGIGAGSKKRIVAKFRKEKNIPFPLFADEKRKIFESLGKPLLPTSYLVRRLPDGGRKIIFVQSGHIDSLEKLVQKVMAVVKEE